jgi:hypothetical protein
VPYDNTKRIFLFRVSILEDIAQGRDGMALNEEGENYDVANVSRPS